MSRDEIELKGLSFYAYHGDCPEEHVLGQHFQVDLNLGLDLTAAGKSDRLEDSVNYTEIYQTVQNLVEGPSVQLIERLAYEILLAVFRLDERIQSVRVKLIKPNPPIPGHYDHVAVIMERDRASVGEEL